MSKRSANRIPRSVAKFRHHQRHNHDEISPVARRIAENRQASEELLSKSSSDMEANNASNNVPITLEFEDIGVSIADREILKNVNGKVKPGQMLAIMGPSGSGKTTLLNILAGRMEKNTGSVRINGKHINKKIKKKIGYVMQEDIFFSHLTLKETLTYSAMLRLPDTLSKSEKLKKVDEIVKILDLSKCLDTCIGSPLERGLSGGEKKRANIGCELIINPSLIFLDEPTSGLDSSNALNLIKTLQDYSIRENKTIVTSIHQPSSQIFHMFDKLLLLCNGQIAFYGKAARVLDFFESLDLICEPHFNPADFILEKVTAGKETEELIVESWKKKDKRQKEITASRKLSRNSEQNGKSSTNSLNSTGICNNTCGMTDSGLAADACVVLGHDAGDIDRKGEINNHSSRVSECKPHVTPHSEAEYNTQGKNKNTNSSEENINTMTNNAEKETPEIIASSDTSSSGDLSVRKKARSNLSKDSENVLSQENLSYVESDSEAELTDSKQALSDIGSDTELIDSKSPTGVLSKSESENDDTVVKDSEVVGKGSLASSAELVNGDLTRKCSGGRLSKKKHHQTSKMKTNDLPLVSFKSPTASADVRLDLHDDDDDDDDDYTDVHTGWVTSFWTQFTVLAQRTFKQSKPEILSKLNFVQTFLLAIVAGLIWFRIPYTEETIRDRYALIFFVVIYWNFNPLFTALLSFPQERTVINKERAAGYFRLSAYYFAKMFSDLPLTVCQPIGFVLIAYFMCGMNESAAFLGFLFVVMLTSLTAQSIGLFISATIMDFKKCITVASVFGLTTMLLGGFYQQHIPWWLKWFEYISYLTYSYRACVVAEFASSPPFRCSELSKYASCKNNGTWITGDEVLQELGITSTLGENVACLLPYCVGFRVLTYLSLRFLHKPK